MAIVTICSDFWVPPNKVCHCFHCFPIYLPWSDGTNAMILVFWMLSFKPTFSLFSSPSSRGSLVLLQFLLLECYYLHIWDYWFLQAILIPACASSSPAFCMMYSAYKLNKEGDLQPWCTPFPIWNQSVIPWLVLCVSSWWSSSPVIVHIPSRNQTWKRHMYPNIRCNTIYNS